MIVSLTIKNYALIQELHIAPSNRLNIITGETGAGKSIMLGALGLLMGNRADTKVLLDAESKCLVEAEIQVEDYKLKELFDELDLDYDPSTILRREITPGGKSRAFINDSPVTLPQMKALGARLMDIHSQHQSLELGNNNYQLDVLDAYAAHDQFVSSYQKRYDAWFNLDKHLQKLTKRAEASQEEQDYKQFLLDELEKAQLDAFNQQELEEELEVLENAEEIKLKLGQVDQLLDASDVAVLEQLNMANQSLSGIQKYAKPLEDLYERLYSAGIELKDIHQELLRAQEDVQLDPERMQQVKGQLDELYRLQKKHQLLDQKSLIELQQKLASELMDVANLDEELIKTRKNLEEAEKIMTEAASKLTESRKLAALDFAAEIEKLIRQLGIENGRVEIEVIPAPPSRFGMDHIAMRFSANKGVTPEEIQHVASGGEFSRLIFAIKYLIAGKTKLPTVIFDEIDTGVSGEVALQMIEMMKGMSNNHQVISISHLPQFAAGGDKHYFVYKDHSADRSESKMRELSGDERITEIAKMIAGKAPTEAAFSSAKELLGIS